MTSPSREAFEAWADARDATHAGKLRSEDRGFDYPLGRVLDECWQAAIQHARDVAARVCNGEMVEEIQPVEHCYNNACVRCADAIKEALK